MSKSIRRRSARALAKKVWNVVLNTKDQKKNSLRSRISDDSNDDGRTVSVSSNDSSQSEPRTADPDPIFETDTTEDDDYMPQRTENHDVSEHDNDATVADENSSQTSTTQEHECDPPSIKDEEKSHAVLDGSLEETVHVDGGLPIDEVVSKTKSEELNDDTSCVSQEGTITALKPQRIGQEVCVEEINEDNAFVEGAEVQIIKGTHTGKCGIISRVTSKCAFISIGGVPKDVRKTKSNEFLKIVSQKEATVHTQFKKQHNSGPQENPFLEGNLVRIKRGTHKDCHGVISRTTEKCVYISIRGLPKDVRKTKSAEFLEILDGDTSCVPQESQQIEQVSISESNEMNVFVAGVRVRIVKGKYLGRCGVILRVTSKCAFVSIEGVTKDLRKTKSDQFLQVIHPMD